MKKLLPIIISFVCLFIVFVSGPNLVFAQSLGQGPTDSRWVIDPEVTFIGKNARRSGDFLDWTLQNYNWVCVKQISTGAGNVQCDDSNNPIEKYWSLIVLYIVVPMLFVVILATSIVIIITRGKSLTVMRFIPRFIAVILLIVFSYSLLQFFYQFTDLIQGFFLRSNINQPCPPNCISDKDLLYVGWDYNNFVGLRLLGDQYAESAFISLLLTKLTALTYFVMVFLLLVRKIILWFFIIVSPIFPILLLYYPVRNTGKIWIGEFFRWLLYAPLFAIFLNGLVYLWRNQIPLVFTNPNIGNAADIEYPTAVNILLGGPRQQVTPTNSVNLVETFALYVVSLIMLWIVILLPWILLQIFLDYAQNFAPGDTAVMKTLVNLATKSGGGGPATPQSPSQGGGGAAISLPFTKKFQVPPDLKPGPTGAAKEINVGNATLNASFNQPVTLPNVSVAAQVLNSANIKLPSMRDIARFDAAMTTNDTSKLSDVSKYSEQLAKIANPAATTNTAERDRATQARQKMVSQSKQGNPAATAVLNAANASMNTIANISNQKVKDVLQQIANPSLASSTDRLKMNDLHSMLKSESTQNNNQLASSILSVNEKTSDKEVQRIKDQLNQSSVSKAVTAAITSTSSTTKTSDVSNQKMKDILQQIANPSLAAPSDRQKMSDLHTTLTNESTQNNNQLASSILSVNEKTTDTEVQKIKEQLGASTTSKVSKEVSSAITETAKSSTQMQNTIKQVANPDLATKSTDKERVEKLRGTLEKASKEGNQLAASILLVNDKTSVTDIEALQQRIQEAKDKGEPVAEEIASVASTTNVTSLPMVNKLQNVKKEDFQAVKDMWKQNYQNLEVPTGMAGNRAEWIKDDIDSIDKTVALLSSPDQDKVQQGMDQVSNILPFLLVGGFSQTEIVNYLRAKQEAAKEVSQQVSVEEEDKLSVTKRATHAEQTMAATMTEDNTGPVRIDKISDINAESEEESPLQNANLASVKPANVNIGSSHADDIFSMTDLEKPKITDIAKFEVRHLKKDKVEAERFEKMRGVLQKIANPSSFAGDPDHSKFESLRQKLSDEKEKGNSNAANVLTAATSTSDQKEDVKVSDIAEGQELGSEQFEEVKKLWIENYETLPVPEGFTSDTNGRIEWIKNDSEATQQTIDLLKSSDTEKKNEGLKKIGNILPFLLLGGFSFKEMTGYLQAKFDAAKESIQSITQDESTKVSVTSAAKSGENAAMENAQEEESEKSK